jgi:hypothetical protein
LAPEQNPENKLREYSKDKKYNEGDLASRNRYGDYVAQSCKHKKKEDMLENSHHFATPLGLSAPCQGQAAACQSPQANRSLTPNTLPSGS